MGITHNIDPEAGVIFSVAEGEIGAEDIQANMDQYTANPLFQPEFRHFFGGRSASFSFSGEEAQKLATRSKNNRPNSKTAIVVKEGPTGYARMFQGWRGDLTNIFYDLVSAREWLGLSPEGEQAMSISFKIDLEEGVIYSVAEGKLGFEDLKTYMTTLRSDPNFSTNLVHILEIRMAQQNISESEVKALVPKILNPRNVFLERIV